MALRALQSTDVAEKSALWTTGSTPDRARTHNASAAGPRITCTGQPGFRHDAAAVEAVHVVGPIRPDPRGAVCRDPVAGRRRARQPAGAARAAQDPEPVQQPATRVHVAVSVRRGLPNACLQSGPVRRVAVPARRGHRPVHVQDPRRPAVPGPVHLQLETTDGRRTVDGSHQTAFLPPGTYKIATTFVLNIVIIL